MKAEEKSGASAWMEQAIDLCRNGFPMPNPRVGCVIVKEGQVVGRGFHAFAGGPHAEINALTEAGSAAKGADVYVTMEPCNHVGRTGPCSQALIAAQVASVTFAVADPNPKAQGGAQTLLEAGIRVSAGLMESEARLANLAWLTAIEKGRPYVMVKVAMSLDGRIALPRGESKWITSEAAREAGRLLRAEMGSVLVGRGTVEKDDPELTVRSSKHNIVNPPIRIVVDRDRKLNREFRVFKDAAPTYRLVKQAIEDHDVEVEIFGDEINLEEALKSLYKLGIRGVLVEGGSKTISHFITHKLVDRLVVFVGAKVLMDGPSWISGQGQTFIPDEQWKLVSATPIGNDVQLIYEPLR